VTSDADRDAIDIAVAEWRQGDCVVGEQWFLHRFSLATPLTEAAVEVAPEGVDIAETPEAGLVVLSQTCDVVRFWRDRPFVEVAPLVGVGKQVLKEIARGFRPRYAFVPGVAAQNLVADLDRVMTVEKAVVASWPRVRGCGSEEDTARFAQALARNRARFAFPDDFSEFVAKLQGRLTEKHDRISSEGEALRSLREIRVVAVPSWAAEEVDLTFLFIPNEDEHGFEVRSWDDFLVKWLELVPPNGRYRTINGMVLSLRDLTAHDYVASAQLDLDHVTSRSA
jgi:hypothetical protein